MKGAALFLVAFLPAVGLLLWASEGEITSAAIPTEESPPASEPLLVPSDLTRGARPSPLPGRVLKLDGFRLRVARGGVPLHDLRIEGLVREEGRPRLKGLSLASHDAEGRLDRTLLADYVDADPASLVPRGSDHSALLSLERVSILDAEGRPFAEIPGGLLLVPDGLFRSDAVATIRLPGKETEILARGVVASDRRRGVSFPGGATATVRRGDATVTVEAAGEVHVEQRGARWFLSTDSACSVAHPAGRAEFRGAEIEMPAKDAEQSRPSRFSLGGPFVALLDPARARGLERVEAARVVGQEDSVLLEGPVRLLLEAEIAGAAGSGRSGRARRFDLRAGGALLRLAAAGGGASFEVDRVLAWGGIDAREIDGPVRLRAETAAIFPRSGLVAARGSVTASLGDAEVSAPAVAAFPLPGGAFFLLVSGPQSTGFRRESRSLRLESAGSLALLGRGESLDLSATREVRLASEGKERFRLRASTLDAAFAGGTLRSSVAAGAVEWMDESRGATLRAERVETRGESVLLARGVPATLLLLRPPKEGAAPEETRVEAESLFLDRSRREFHAARAIHCRLPGGRSIRCDRLEGTLDERDELRAAVATGRVRGDLADEGSVEGDLLEIDLRTGAAAIRGAPALLRRPDGLSVRAPGFDVMIGGAGGRREIVRAAAIAAGDADLPLPGQEGAGGARLLRVRFRGPASLERNRLWIPAGASFAAHDADGTLRAEGEARSLAIFFRRGVARLEPTELVGLGAVRVSDARGIEGVTLTAREARYLWGDARLRLRGDCLVVDPKGARARFQEAEVILGRSGLEIVRVTEIEAASPAKR